ncbi:MAG: hypothetical protein GY855_17085, partial [candidate division Zixibacteria bacterium]|nr:hypothetical protein [candidate division Zixibacteria bacterium]
MLKLTKITLITVLISLFTVPAVYAYNFYDVTFGSNDVGLSARSMAMGSVGMNSESNGNAVFINPAQLSNAEKLLVNLDYRMTYVREAWSFPAHDNFDGYLVDNIYSQSAIVYP